MWLGCGSALARADGAAISAGEVPTASPPPLRVLTWNVENYLLVDRRLPEGYRPDYPKPESEKTALRAVIRSAAPDIIVLQEMGPAPFLAELQRDLRNEGLDYPYSALVEAADADRHVAMLARHEPLAVKTYTDLTFKYLDKDSREQVRRGLLEVHVAIPGGPGLTLFGMHLKSRYTERPDDPDADKWRAGEAVAIRDNILRLHPDPGTARFLILGDANDSPGTRPLRALAARGDTPIAEPLAAADDRGDRWTYLHRATDSYQRIDHVLASPGLLASCDVEATILDSPEVRAASDHRPILVIVTPRVAASTGTAQESK